MSRKENLKKSLGITEYPWSSDDDDNNTNSEPVRGSQVPRRPSADPRPSTAETSGSSGSQPTPTSPASVRRQQAKMDRALFWSIINNTARPNTAGERSSRIIGDVPLSCTRNVLHVRPSDMRDPRRDPNNRTDIQRILAFKKLTRNLHSLAQKQPGSEGLYASTSRVLGSGSGGGPSRSSLFTPLSTSTSELLGSSSRHTSRHYDGPSRSQPARSSLQPYSRTRNDVLTATEPVLSETAAYRSPPEPYVTLDHSEDEAEPTTQMVSASTSRDESAHTADDDNDEEANNQTVSVSMEEEIVEVDGPDEQEMVPEDIPVPAQETQPVNISTNNESNHEPVVTTPPDSAVVPQSPTASYQGIKRKRDANGDIAEPYSVKEFNQQLLRLLECPVCLEWMEPPISQCRRGHLVCSRCRARLASCPVCRTTFSSVRNRAMEGVAEMLRYPCRHGCAREVRLRRRAAHEASCGGGDAALPVPARLRARGAAAAARGARRYQCPAAACAKLPPLARTDLDQHFQVKHSDILKEDCKHKFSMKVNAEQHDVWLIKALDELFHLRVDVDIRTWGVIVYMAYIGPKRKAKYFTYQVTVLGQHNNRKLLYSRMTHSDLESLTLNVSRQDCFHLTLDQALNFLRFKNRHCEPDKFLDFEIEISKVGNFDESKDDSDS